MAHTCGYCGHEEEIYHCVGSTPCCEDCLVENDWVLTTEVGALAWMLKQELLLRYKGRHVSDP
jgi:hypothetical protein